ncbi:DUF397 domain-containing protein [Streptomyces tauricus]|uniref:DUF397 domain-containing protein n=1 Tax=Streptomyces tauricus TaxID=68274 RepID=UPI0033E32C8D
MTTPDSWQKSSFSGGGDGNACVELATEAHTIRLRESDTPPHRTHHLPHPPPTSSTAYVPAPSAAHDGGLSRAALLTKPHPSRPTADGHSGG